LLALGLFDRRGHATGHLRHRVFILSAERRRWPSKRRSRTTLPAERAAQVMRLRCGLASRGGRMTSSTRNGRLANFHVPPLQTGDNSRATSRPVSDSPDRRVHGEHAYILLTGEAMQMTTYRNPRDQHWARWIRGEDSRCFPMLRSHGAVRISTDGWRCCNEHPAFQLVKRRDRPSWHTRLRHDPHRAQRVERRPRTGEPIMTEPRASEGRRALRSGKL